ncbi:AAA domain-containing protein [Cryobacterium sp. TMT2-23]|uniref:AAA domain-containing protein n=1 Tax=Cryobacterium sp. TMT2-23 TaxID=1259252 RepID=UPI001069EB58|nr:AAA domain-containing protein [Cryobacterium sp. TMT2-23]TFD29141.1 DUF4011 domain-containing protein [Cryobacterium sp. TMT2-23]
MSREIEAASKEWRSALIDVGGNNRLLYFKPNASTIDLTALSAASLSKLLSGTTVRLSELFTNAAELKKAQRACAALARKEREATEEYGVSVAFLAVGLATWDPEASQAIAEAEDNELSDPSDLKSGRPSYTRPSAPALLRPLEIAKKRGAQDAWELRLDEDLTFNGVLAHVMNADRQRLNEEEVLDLNDGTSSGIESMLEDIEDSCSDVEGFAIERKYFLGAFSYLKQSMVADVDDLNALADSDIIAALAGDPAAAERVRTQAGEVSEAQPDYTPVDSEFLVLDADSSQSFIINAALSGRNLVVEGPPGTGKSQTIANAIASLVAANKKVLFVAQKRAAVTAVLDRLEAVDLGHLVLDLFAATGSRRFVSEELRDVLDRQYSTGVPNVANLHFQLSASRDRLVHHKDALVAKKHGWGVSVADLRARMLGIPPGARTSLRLSNTVFTPWSNTGLAEYGNALNELHSIGALSPAWQATAGWSPSAMTTTTAVGEWTNAVQQLASVEVPNALNLLNRVSSEAGEPIPDSWEDLDLCERFLNEVAAVQEAMSDALDPILEDVELEMMLIATGRQYAKTASTTSRWGERRIARNRARTFNTTLNPKEIHHWLLRAKDVRHRWRGTGPAHTPTDFSAAQTACAQIRAGLSTLQGAVQQLDVQNTSLNALSGVLTTLATQRERLQMPRAHTLEVVLSNAGLGPVLATLRLHFANHKPLGCTPAEILDWVATQSILENAEMTDPALAGITGQDLDTAVAQFKKADQEHLAANAARIKRLAAERLKSTLDANPAEHSILKTETTRKRNFRSVRSLFEEAPNVVLAAKPVWAMSPLQVSRLLPPVACFDVVIFDEASQVKPADAIPSLLRARQAVIAGDSRQLPPTEFFAKVLDDLPSHTSRDEFDDAPVDEDAALDSIAPAPVKRKRSESLTKDAESILFAMDRLLAGQSRRLLWHYRSRDERLIAVSNAYVYSHSLTTFPAADTADALRHVSVEPSLGIGGTANSPAAEVARVVELVREHVATHPEESLGVITFGIKHQRRIEAALDEAMNEDPQFAEALTSVGEPCFVKSIERVQGDERDAIILTVGYGKGVDGKLRYFWGPLLQEGGERRLNVAISRARRRMTFVTSFTTDDVPEDGHHSPGFKLMYRFLRFMASDGAELTGGADRTMPLNPFEIDIRDRLTAAGLSLDPQVGVGSYRIDFAARHPSLPGKHVLAIEADGASYHSGNIARERDRLRQTLLERRGWTFHRIWSTDWFNDAETEVQKAVDAYKAALGPDLADEPDKSSEQKSSDLPSRSWHVEEARPSISRPHFYPGRPITEHSAQTLLNLVLHVRSDGKLRATEDEFLAVMHELGYNRRGSRINAAISRAQRQADNWGAQQRQLK